MNQENQFESPREILREARRKKRIVEVKKSITLIVLIVLLVSLAFAIGMRVGETLFILRTMGVV